MATYSYSPQNSKLPDLQKLNVSSQIPVQNIGNSYAKNILDSFKKNLTAPTAYTDKYNMNDALAPITELGNEYIQRAVVPEFQRNTFDPFIRQMQNRTASSNISLLGSNPRFQQQQTRQITQPFENQVSQVQQTFADLAQQSLNDRLKNFYDSQLNF